MEKAVAVKSKQFKDYNHLVQAGYSPITASLLYSRGYKTVEECEDFLNPTLDKLHDSNTIKNIDKVINMILESINKKVKIGIHGDYDVDGLTSSVIAFNSLKELGADVVLRLPDRLSEGYGMSMGAIDEFKEDNVGLVITVDNGIKSIKEVQHAKDLGMKVIILDHHTIGDELPNADVIIDLHSDDETYPFKELAGCGVAYKVVSSLYKAIGLDGEEEKFLDLVAIGTIADVVPLIGENRILVKAGLDLINSKDYNRVGIKALLKKQNLSKVTSLDIGFSLAPCFNATGRLLEKGAELSLELLLEEHYGYAKLKAEEIAEVNEMRKALTEEFMNKIEDYIIQNSMENDLVLVVYDENIPEGISGLISGKLTEKYSRPSIVFSKSNDYYKASGRSVESFDIYKAVDIVEREKKVLMKFGGHKQAVGLSVKYLDQIETLRNGLNDFAKFLEFQPDNTYYVDEILYPHEVTHEFVQEVSKLEPFGSFNQSPLYYIKYYEGLPHEKYKKHYFCMGKKKNHLKVYGTNLDLVGFGMAEKFFKYNAPLIMDVIGTVSFNVYNEKTTVQLQAKDFEPHKEKTLKMELTHRIINNMGDLIAVGLLS